MREWMQLNGPTDLISLFFSRHYRGNLLQYFYNMKHARFNFLHKNIPFIECQQGCHSSRKKYQQWLFDCLSCSSENHKLSRNVYHSINSFLNSWLHATSWYHQFSGKVISPHVKIHNENSGFFNHLWGIQLNKFSLFRFQEEKSENSEGKFYQKF